MQNISRKITAVAIASALIIPTTATTAHAQLSFGSSDFGSSILEDSTVSRLQSGYEQRMVAFKGTPSSETQAVAEAALKKALAGELTFTHDSSNGRDAASGIEYFVDRLTQEDADYFLLHLEDILREARTVDVDPTYGGVAVGKSGDYYYVSLSFQRMN